jgi:hypothetical protein
MTMGTTGLRQALALAALLALAACAQPQGSNQGSDGRVAQGGEPGGGIGGTGAASQPLRQVGILGTLRGFGSLLVNGVRVETPAGAPVATPYGPRQVSDLAAGHVVELAARGDDGTLRAQRIAQLVALAGPVEAVQADARALSVMGVPVQLAPGARVAADGGLAAVRPGTRIAVSGLWREGGVVASRIEPAPTALPALDAGPATTALVTGVIRVGPDGERRVGPLPLAFAGTTPPPEGQFAALYGRLRGDTLEVLRIETGHPALPARLDRLSVEAYAGTVHGTPALHGLGLQVAEGTRLERLFGRRAVFIGPLQGRFRVEHGVPLPDAMAAQRDALEAVGDGLRPRRGAVETR